jgi:putative membrane protein
MLNETVNGVVQAHYMNGSMGYSGHYGWGLMHGPFSVVLFITFIFLVVMLFRRFAHGGSVCGHGASSSALSALSERFAKGEIDEDEFRAKRSVLKSKK